MSPSTPLSAPISPVLNVAAELAVNLSVALKNRSVYGAGHPVAKASFTRAMDRFHLAFRHQNSLHFHFARATVIFGQSYLDRKNSIFKQHATTFWGLGVVGVQYSAGMAEEELDGFLGLIADAGRPNLKPDARRVLLGGGTFPHIALDILDPRQMMVREQQAVAPKDTAVEERLWHDFLMSLEGPVSADAKEFFLSQSVMELARKISRKGKEEGKDYGTAVVDYMKKVDQTFRQEGVLRKTETGKRIADLVAAMDPAMRQQILGACLTDETLSPVMVHELNHIVGHETILNTLQKLNAEGRAIPITIYRTLSLVSMMDDETLGDEFHDDEDPHLHDREHEGFQSLLDNLLSADDRCSFVTPEYEAKIEALQAHAEQLAQEQLQAHARSLFSRFVAEEHFMGVVSEQLGLFPKDVEQAGAIAAQMDPVYRQFAEARQFGNCQLAILLERQAAKTDPKAATVPHAWEEETEIARLMEVLVGEDRDDAVKASRVMAAIGPKAIPAIVDLLATSPSMDHRMHAVSALIDMESNPSRPLLALLANAPPWFVARNIIYVLRKRKDPAGEADAEAFWEGAHPKAKIEIIRYLYTLRRKEWLQYFKRAVDDPSRELVLSAARLLLNIRWNEVAAVVQARAERVPGWDLGSPFHLELLRYLVRSGNRQARNYVATLPHARKAWFFWRRNTLRRAVASMLKEA